MLKKSRLFLSGFFIVVFTQLLCGQNYFVSNLYNNLIFSNPAIASFNNFSFGQLNYRNQWPVADLYTTYGGAYFHSVENLNSNFGVVINHDRQFGSVFTKTSLGLNYAYSLKAGYWNKVLFGISGNYNIENNNFNQLTFENPILNIPENHNVWYPLINSGIAFVFGREHLIGISVNNILGQNTNNLLTREFHLSYIGRIKMKRIGNLPLMFEPIGDVYLKNNLLGSSFGCNLGFSSIKTGILFTQSNLNLSTTTFLLGILYDNYEFIYTYDLNLSGAISINPKMAAHEVTFLRKFEYKGKRKKHRAIKCPKL